MVAHSIVARIVLVQLKVGRPNGGLAKFARHWIPAPKIEGSNPSFPIWEYKSVEDFWTLDSDTGVRFTVLPFGRISQLVRPSGF